jgi:hypothetical protein
MKVVVSAANIDALSKKMAWRYCYHTELYAMGRSAAQRTQQFAWDVYGEHVVVLYQQVVENT